MTGCTCQTTQLAKRISQQWQTAAVTEDVEETCLTGRLGAGDECEHLTECDLRKTLFINSFSFKS